MIDVITNPIVAIEIWKDLGYSQDTRELYLKTRWYNKDGLVTAEEWRTYCRLMALRALRHHRKVRSQASKNLYQYWKGEIDE